MDPQIAADRTPAPLPSLPLRGVPREAVDAFLRDTRPWALRQARRSYRHLPDSLREQAVDRACAELRIRAPQSLERRALAAGLAERLTQALRDVHVGWCEDESGARLRREGTEPVLPEVRREGLAHFVDAGLGGLERAVLQLEIGAGRDTRTARAALRLGPRQYASHREAGLSKLRDAISAQVNGRACDQHVSGIVSAATGDKAAMDALNAGPHRCRYCAREAQGLRSVLHERLAIAPWPIVVKPAGLLAAKLGVVGTAFGGKGAGAGAGVLGAASGSGASTAATVLAAAALATGTAGIVDNGDTKREGRSERAAQTSEKPSAPARKAAESGAATTAAVSGARRKTRIRSASGAGQGAPGTSRPTSAASATDPAAGAAVAAAPESGATGSESTESSGPVTTATKPVTDTVNGVAEAVTSKLPPVVAEPVDQTVDQVTAVVDDAGTVVDELVPQLVSGVLGLGDPPPDRYLGRP